MPTFAPTVAPSQPTSQPSGQPSRQPSGQPSASPTQPTGSPTGSPTGQPSASPTTLAESKTDFFVNATTDLITAVQSGSVTAVQAVIDSMGAEELKATNFAYTAVTAAIFSDHQAAVSVIVAKTGLDLSQQGVTGNTPLMWASLFGRESIVQALVLQGADCTLRNKDGLTALDLSNLNGYRSISVFLRANCKAL